MATETIVISKEEVDHIAKAIQETARVPKGTEEEFCKIWPSVKSGLEALKTILQFVPGVGTMAIAAIAIVTAAGDAAMKAFCP